MAIIDVAIENSIISLTVTDIWKVCVIGSPELPCWLVKISRGLIIFSKQSFWSQKRFDKVVRSLYQISMPSIATPTHCFWVYSYWIFQFDSLAPPFLVFKNRFPDLQIGKLKKLHDHVTKIIIKTFILNSRRPRVQMRPNLYDIRPEKLA